MRQTFKRIAPLFSMIVMITFVASVYAQTETAKRKYVRDVKYYNPHMAVILETSIYDMFEAADTTQLFNRLMRNAIKDPVAEIMSGFNYLKASTLPQDKTMAKKWGMPDTTSASWLEWFGDRVKLITAADHTQEDFWTSRFEVDKRYPINSTSLRVVANNQKSENNTATAQHLTSALLSRSLNAGYAMRYKGPNFPKLVSGAHFGIVKLYLPFFKSLPFRVRDENATRFNEYSYVSKIYRNSVLLHEARHSDGAGTSAGFGHVSCPMGHPDYNPDKTKKVSKNCDRSQNGPYSISADFIKLYLAACKAGYNLVCTADEIDILGGFVTESEAQVLDADIYPLDGDGNKVVEYLDPAPYVFKNVPESKMSRE